MKIQLREQAKKLRDRINDPHKGNVLRDNFIKNVEIPLGSIIGCYWPTGSEIDVKPLITKLYNDGHDICLPCIVEPNAPLIFRQWTPETVMMHGKFRIYEPDKRQDEMIPTMLITPLLAFDKVRHRLGYGGGYYDRTIAKYKSDGHELYTIGVAFAEQEIDAIPAGEFDVQLDKIVTEFKVLG